MSGRTMPLFVVWSRSSGLTTTRSPSGFSDKAISAPFSLHDPGGLARRSRHSKIPRVRCRMSAALRSHRPERGGINAALLVEQPLVDGFGRVIEPMSVASLVRLDPAHVERPRGHRGEEAGEIVEIALLCLHDQPSCATRPSWRRACCDRASFDAPVDGGPARAIEDGGQAGTPHRHERALHERHRADGTVIASCYL